MSDDPKEPRSVDHKRISTDEEYWSRKFSVNADRPKPLASKARAMASGPGKAAHGEAGTRVSDSNA